MRILLFFFSILLLPYMTGAQIIITVAGTGAPGFGGDGGPAIDAMISAPYGIALDKSGNLFICDYFNVRIRKVSPAYGGIITTVSGNGSAGYSGDGFSATSAETDGVTDIAVDRNDNLYLADAGNNRVRKVTPDGIITTYGGTGIAGYNGDGIPAIAAQLNAPQAVAVDDTGNVYIADRYNNRVRKIDTFGIITTVAGSGTAGFCPDGCKADTSAMNYVMSVEVDHHGALYFSDNVRIRKLDTAGRFITIAGNGVEGYSGDGGPATSAKIESGYWGIDTFGNCYLVDDNTSRIRKIGINDTITTIAGYGYTGYGGDWGNPLMAKFALPQGIVIAPNGDIFIGDAGNNRIRMITTHITAISGIDEPQAGIQIYPNPAHSPLRLMVQTTQAVPVTLSLYDISGREVAHAAGSTNEMMHITTHLPSGIYIVIARTETQTFTERLVVE